MKTKKIIAIVIIIVALIVTAIAVFPSVAETVYLKNPTNNNLVFVCNTALLYSNEDMILSYVPLLPEGTENMDAFMIALLNSSINCQKDEYKANLEKAFLNLSEATLSVSLCNNSINLRYEAEKDKDYIKELYDSLVSISPNPEYRYLIFQQENKFFYFTVGDTEYSESTQKERAKLWEEYEEWSKNQPD